MPSRPRTAAIPISAPARRPLSTEVVNQAVTTTTVTASIAQTVFTQPLTFTATLGFTVGNASMPGGAVTFMDGSNVLNITNVNGGSTTYTTSTLAAGTHTITARYSGDANFSTSSGTLSGGQTVNPAVTSTAISPSVNPTVIGQTVVFPATVTVESEHRAGTRYSDFPGQRHHFSHRGVKRWHGHFPTTSLAFGDHVIAAFYNGDSNYSSSSSFALTQTVNQASTATSVTTSSNPGIFGQWVTFTATVAVIAPGSDIPTGSVTFQFGGR